MKGVHTFVIGVIAALIMLVLMILLSPAYAHVFTQPECRKAAGTVLAAAEAKGDGVKANMVIPAFMEILTGHKGEAGSFIKDDSDLETLQHAFSAVYAKDITPGQAYDEFFFPCSRAYTDKGGS